MARAILRQIRQVEREHHGCIAGAAEIEVGPLSGVEPVLLQAAFDDLVAADGACDITLSIQEVPLMARCKDCQQETRIEAFRFTCAKCFSNRLQVTRGDGVYLVHVDLQPSLSEG